MLIFFVSVLTTRRFYDLSHICFLLHSQLYFAIRFSVVSPFTMCIFVGCHEVHIQMWVLFYLFCHFFYLDLSY